MRIALTADPELPVPPILYGGIERIVDMLARKLVTRGHDVVLFARPGSDCPVPKIGWPGLESSSKLDTVRNAATLARHVASHHFDVLHSFSRLAYLLPILPLRVPKLMTYQREICPRTTRLAHRLARGTLEFSAISRSMLAAAPLAGAWHLVPNGVPLDSYTFQGVVAQDAPLVFLGRIEETKGPHLAIEVARRSGRNLVIAGNIPEAHRRWFEAVIAPHIDDRHVHYVGPVDDAQKNKLLGSAAAFLMPILWEEPFGIVMAEAMACGTPVIGLRRGAVPEVVEDGVSGFITDTVDGLISAVGRIGTLDRFAARRRVETCYSDDAVTDGYLTIYRKIHERVKVGSRSSEFEGDAA
jgi:glycosyltransferase involved in cell wall biosynthesis